ncbi:uncharacterized protein LOC108673678 [Hyalella azteca]|uniref:Uncharacterized protein LOC108673678 n=1 Tax=Hyalella azteca TaxID=294128 RepID=A0A8B7NTJ2_HYAAZ|nr:uncharacterized protein LOC108673678 [Hyalella azteca]
MGGCLGFSYNGGACQPMGVLTTLVAASGWTSYAITQQISPQLLNPCASSPCPPTKVCVKYSPPANVPFHPEAALNFSMSGFVCTNATSLLDQRNQNKSCKLVAHWYTDLQYFDIGVPEYLSISEAFDRCSLLNCVSFVGVFYASGTTKGIFKSTAPLMGAASKPYPTPPTVISWFPECA